MIGIVRNFLYHLTHIACTLSPYTMGTYLAKREYRRITGLKMNLSNPQNLIEKIVWMQFHTDTSLWTKCADKYAVRSYVESKGLGHILPKLYGKWETSSEIDWDSLPEKFVMKTNNSCGQNLIVRKKVELNIEDANKKLNKWIKERYGHHNGQLHYLRIEPKIIAEELLEDPFLKKGESLIDYKVLCFNGNPECIMIITGRNGSEYYVSMYDLSWHNISEVALSQTSPHFCGKTIPKPKNLDTMLEYARILSVGFSQVRVDFYNIDGQIFFGEMTFTTGYGYRSEEFSKYLGSKINLSNIQKIR